MTRPNAKRSRVFILVFANICIPIGKKVFAHRLRDYIHAERATHFARMVILAPNRRPAGG
jgi:hypothetical protein